MGRGDRAALRDIKVKVRYAPEKFAPVNDVPDGNIEEILAWVNYSPLRARRALKREMERETPRIRLIKILYGFLQRIQDGTARTINTTSE